MPAAFTRGSPNQASAFAVRALRSAGSHPAESGRARADQARLFGYIHSLVRDSNDADDLFQQTAMVLWRKFAEYDPARPFLGWACGVARFEVTNFLRTRGRSKLYFSDDLNLLLIEATERLTSDEAIAAFARRGGR